MTLGTYPDIQTDGERVQELARGFKRKENGYEELILI